VPTDGADSHHSSVAGEADTAHSSSGPERSHVGTTPSSRQPHSPAGSRSIPHQSPALSASDGGEAHPHYTDTVRSLDDPRLGVAPAPRRSSSYASSGGGGSMGRLSGNKLATHF